MKPMLLPVILSVLSGWLPASGQVGYDIPAPPGSKQPRRTTGPSSPTGVQATPTPPAKVRQTTYIVLSPSRIWTSHEGKPLQAKLIAFEDIVTEGTVNGQPPAAPTPPAHPTVVRNDKVRLLTEKKAVEVPLSRLSQADRNFIEQIRLARAAAAPVK